MNKTVAENKLLDFTIIGAQKAGTSSLFQYLRRHPQLHIPRGKEIPFFSQDDRYERGYDSFVKEFFSGAPTENLWGTVSPQYMADPLAPGRMHEMMPAVKLIAILRNPIHRALSHYKMAVRRSNEKRSFDQAVGELVNEEAACHARTLRPRDDNAQCYLVWGEYARILSTYRSLFPREQIMAVFSEDLERTPREIYQSILRFLDVSPDFLPDNLGRRYHQGGTKSRIRAIENDLRKSEILRRLWRRIPGRQRMYYLRAYVRFNHWNTITEPSSSSADITPRTLAKLVDYYRPEVERLRSVAGEEAPWPEFR